MKFLDWLSPSTITCPKVLPPVKPRRCVEMVKRTLHPEGIVSWDIKCDGRSVTDDYGFGTEEKAKEAFLQWLAVEKGEVKSGLEIETVWMEWVDKL